MQWIISKIVPVIIDLLVKLILKWVADQEAQRQAEQGKKPASVNLPPKEPVQVDQGWGDKSFRTGKGPGGIV
jgi:hypothetical protein